MFYSFAIQLLQPVIAPEKAGATATKAAWQPGVCNPVKNMEKHKKMTANEARDESRKVAPNMKRAKPTEPTPFNTLLKSVHLMCFAIFIMPT